MTSPPSGIVVGPLLQQAPNEAAALVASIVQDRLIARKKVVQSDGDVRYWGVDPSQSGLLARLVDFGHARYREAVGRDPVTSLLMVNSTDAQRCPTGSGGGWHRDSFSKQYKAFAYLTDVDRSSQGAFAYIPGSNSPWFRVFSLAHRVVSGANRYDDRTIDRLARLGFRQQPVLLKSAVPFFLDTSLVHRGLPIREGLRIMATAYMFQDVPKWLGDYQ